MTQEVDTPTDAVAAIPAQVRALAARLGAREPAPQAVRLVQSGRIRGEGRGGWLQFRARQTIANDACRFTWRARVGALGLIGVRDRLDGAEGELSVKALGVVPLAHSRSSPMLVRGEAMRYLAELALAPDAILANPFLRWRVREDGNFSVATGSGESAAEIHFTLDAEGRIETASAPDRPKSVGEGFVPTPWRGRYSDYRRHAGRLIPFHAEALWTDGAAEDVYWRGDILSWRTDPQG